MKRVPTFAVFFLAIITHLQCAELQLPTLPIGSSAPAFQLPGVDGRDYSLQDFSKARILTVIFTCNHCPTAQYYEGRIKQIVEDYRAKGVAVVAIMPNDPKSVRLDELGWTDLSDTFEEMKIRAKDRGFNFPYLYDGETEGISRAYPDRSRRRMPLCLMRNGSCNTPGPLTIRNGSAPCESSI